MRWSQAIKLDLKDHWVNKARGVGGDQLPDNVVARWSYFARQARRSRNGYYFLEALALVLAASIPASAALGASIEVAAALGAAVVVANGLRQIGGLHEEWISSAQARYAIEREIVLFTWGKQPYQEPSARANLAEEVEKIAASEGERFVVRREMVSKSEDSPRPT
jgi:hypothetical protein